MVSCRAACVGTGAAAARVFCFARVAAATACSGGPAARACGARRGEGETAEALSSRPALHAARGSQHLAARAGVCCRSAALTTLRRARQRRVSAALGLPAFASVLHAASKHRARTRRAVAFHALEDVTPRLLVCFWTWLATSIYEASSSLGICCWSQRLKRGGRKRTHVFLPTAPRLIAALRPRTQRRGSQPTLNTECCTHYYLAARRRAPHT